MVTPLFACSTDCVQVCSGTNAGCSYDMTLPRHACNVTKHTLYSKLIANIVVACLDEQQYEEWQLS